MRGEPRPRLDVTLPEVRFLQNRIRGTEPGHASQERTQSRSRKRSKIDRKRSGNRHEMIENRLKMVPESRSIDTISLGRGRAIEAPRPRSRCVFATARRHPTWLHRFKRASVVWESRAGFFRFRERMCSNAGLAGESIRKGKGIGWMAEGRGDLPGRDDWVRLGQSDRPRIDAVGLL